VNPEYHPKIIGRKGAVITQLRSQFDVSIQLPKKEDVNGNVITIMGYEKNASEAQEAIMKIVSEFENLVKENVQIDQRVHSMIIGQRGRGIRKIMQDYNVDIKLPREGDSEPNLVQITGPSEDNVMDCKEHLLDLAEEFEQEVQDKVAMDQYLKPASKHADGHEKKSKNDGFKVAKAPWHGASDDAFPSLAGGPGAAEPPVVSTPAWGPKR
jgi:polyribonucleotide nucleotidyltransferase